MRFGKWIIIALALMVVAAATPASAQSVSDSDFFSVESVTLPLNKDTTFSILVSMTNATPAAGITLPLTFAANPNIQLDTSFGVSGAKGITQETLGADGVWTIKSLLADTINQTLLIGYLSFFGALPPSSGPLVRIHFKLKSTPSSDVVYLDSLTLPPDNRLSINDEASNTYIPQFTRGVITIGNPQPSIQLTPTSLSYSAVIGTPNPAAKSFTVENVGAGDLNWTVTDNQPWITASPLSGTNTGTVNVSVNTAGLASGTHTGMVTVSDPAADNSPQTVSVTLTLTKPNIAAVPSSLSFTAEAGGANPAPIDFQLLASSSASIAWTASKAATWLSVSPTSGTTPSSLTASANITGLTAGTHRDTIIFTAANASNTPYKVPVLLTLTEPPADLHVSPTAFSFTAVEGGANPATQPLSITNVGGGTLNWTITGQGPWSTVSAASGTAPSTVDVGADITSLTAGSYVDTITVASAGALNSPQEVIINLTVEEPPPVIALSPTTLDYNAIEGGANPPAQSVSVTNTGGGTLNFNVATDAAWLSTTPTSGTAPQSFDVNVDVTGLVADTYTGNVIVSAAGAANTPETVAVSLLVQANPPVLVVDPVSAAFTATEGDASSSPTSVTVNITNTGGGTLDFTISGIDAGWLDVTPLSGTAPQSLSVSADPTGMLAGSYADTFQVVSAGAINSPTDVIVTFDVAAGPPEISLSPLTFFFTAVEGGPNPPGQTLNITNIGGSTPLVWGAGSDQPWLSLSPDTGTAPSTPQVLVDITGLPADTVVVGHISVTAVGATNSPQVIEVTLTVNAPPPHIAVAPASLNFEATLGDPDPPSQNLDITNTGGGTLDWTASTDEAWLSVDQPSGTAPSTIAVSAALAGLTPGVYNGNVTIASGEADNSPVTVPVQFTVYDMPPVLSVSPLALTFDGQQGEPNPPSQSFNISNTGGMVLSWTVSSPVGWLGVSPTAGTDDASVSVSVDLTGLSAGTHEADLTVDAGSVDGSPALVHVTFNVAPPPPASIVLSPTSFSFTALFGGSNPPSQTLDITNGGGRELNWTASNSESWLILSPTSGTAPSSVDLSIDITGLAVGTYYDTVVVASDSADNSPQKAAVTLQVTDNPPQIVLSPTALYFEAVVGGADPALKSFSITNGGAGTLNWTATKKSPWLTIAPAGGTAPSSVDVSVALGGLSPGTYRDTVYVSSGDAINSPQACVVTFLVKDVVKPSLELQPDSLYFIVEQGQVSDPQCIYVFIDGNGGRAVWRGLTDADWIDLSRDSCNISYPVCVTVDAFGFEPGVYCDSVEFTGDISNGPQYLHVCMDVRSGGAEPILVVRDTIYNFEATEGDTDPTLPQSFTVTNAGAGTMTWSASTLASWLVIDPTSGTAPSSGTFTVHPIGLTAGSYSTAVQFDAPSALNSPTFVEINLTVHAVIPEPHIVVDPASISATASEGGTDTLHESITVTNGGGGTLDYSSALAAGDGWLEITGGASGTAPGSISLDLLTEGLAAGTYYDTVVVSSATADNSPVGVPVMLEITPVATANIVTVGETTIAPGGSGSLWVNFENTFPLSGVTVPLIFTSTGVQADSVSFVGSRVESVDVLEATIDSGAQRILIGAVPVSSPPIPAGSGKLAQIFFSVAPDAPFQTVTIDSGTVTGPLVELAYVDTLANKTVPDFVAGTLHVEGAGPVTMQVTPDSLDFSAAEGGDNPTPAALMIRNLGGGTMNFTISDDMPWLTVSPASGTDSAEVFATVDITGLTEGSYSGVITFTSPEAVNSPVTVPVTMTITPAVNPPVIALTPDHLDFSAAVDGANPPAQGITVANIGGPILSWTATKSESWLSIAPASGSDGDVITVSVDITGLAAGDYTDTIVVTDASASNSPQKAPVNLHIGAPASPDTVFVASVETAPGTTVDVAVRIKNTFSVAGITLPLAYSGTGVTLTGGSVTARSGGAIFAIYSEDIDPVAQTGLFGFISFGDGMTAGDGDVLILHFDIAADAPSQVITIDTTFLPPANHLTLVDPLANEFFPEFEAGQIVVTGAGANTVWVTEATGESGGNVYVDVYAENAMDIDRLLLPLRLTSTDVSIVTADFTGTRAALGTPTFNVIDDQTFTIDIEWNGAPLPAGSGPMAHLTLALAPGAPDQTAYVDTAGEFGFIVTGGSQSLMIPTFTRGTVYISTATDVNEDPFLPGRFALDQNYPNPFNPATSIVYSLTQPAFTSLTVYNLLGQRVITLVSEYQRAGVHTVQWNGLDEKGGSVPSGVYLYRLQSGSKVAQMKMTLMK